MDMSDQTLIVGSLIFNDGTPEKTKLKILEEFATAIEVEVPDLRYNVYSGQWEFQNINWQSHVEKEGIEKFLEQWKGYIKKLNCSLHHLTEPEEINYRKEVR